MKVDFRALANTGIRNLIPYQPGKPIEEVQRELGISSPIIKLASNENPLGASPKAIEAAQQEIVKMHLYPDGSCYELKQKLASFLSVMPEQITIGNGSENIFEIIIKAYSNPNNSAVISQYAFLTISLLLQSYGTQIITVPAKEWSHDIDAMIEAIGDNTRLLFLVNPNNPTGTYTNIAAFEKLLKSVPPHVLIVVDEAYSEYISQPDYPNAIDYLTSYPNLIVTRTFSKIYGLAALRLGYAISSPDIADILNRSRLPFNVNGPAAKAGCAAIADIEHVRKTIELNNTGIEIFKKELTNLQLPYIPPIANFVTTEVGDGMDVYKKLLTKGVIVRPLNPYGMPKHIRISTGTIEQNQRVINELSRVLA